MQIAISGAYNCKSNPANINIGYRAIPYVLLKYIFSAAILINIAIA